jgi:hypothetical protein
MTIQITTWTAGHCNCIIQYEWDDTTSEDTRVHTPVQSIKCPIHSGLSTHKQVYDSVLDESRKASWGLLAILDNGPTTLYDTQSNGARTLKQGINASWTFSGTAPNRTVSISLTGISLSNQQRNAIQNTLNNKFGSGQVTLV